MSDFDRCYVLTRRFAHKRWGWLPKAERDERTAEAIALAWREWLALIKRGQNPANLIRWVASISCKMVQQGATVHGRHNHDLHSDIIQRKRGCARLDYVDEFAYREAFDERRDDIPAIVAAKLDMEAFAALLPEKQQKLLAALMTGLNLGEAAQAVGYTRDQAYEVRTHWRHRMQAEEPEPARRRYPRKRRRIRLEQCR